jgi:hypothetical protein
MLTVYCLTCPVEVDVAVPLDEAIEMKQRHEDTFPGHRARVKKATISEPAYDRRCDVCSRYLATQLDRDVHVRDAHRSDREEDRR